MEGLNNDIFIGPSWLYAITKTHNNVYNSQRRQEEEDEGVRAPRPRDPATADWEERPPQPSNIPVPPPPPADVPHVARNPDHENMLIQEALFSYRRYPQVIQSK